MFLLTHIFSLMKLHAQAEVAMQQVQAREQSVVGLFAAERSWLCVQRERHADRVMAHVAGIEVRLMALECLRRWLYEVESASFADQAARRTERYLTCLDSSMSVLRATEPQYTCLTAWRLYVCQVLFARHLEIRRNACKQVSIKFGKSLWTNHSEWLLHLCLEEWRAVRKE